MTSSDAAADALALAAAALAADEAAALAAELAAAEAAALAAELAAVDAAALAAELAAAVELVEPLAAVEALPDALALDEPDEPPHATSPKQHAHIMVATSKANAFFMVTPPSFVCD